MSLHFNTYSIILLISGIAAAIVGIVLFQRKHPAITWFALMMHASAIWAIAYSFELSSSTLSQMLFWINVEYIGVAYLPSIWLVFVIYFIGKTRWLKLPTVILIFLIPTLTFLMVITNSYHHFHYASTGLNTSGPFPLLAIVTGPWYTIHTIFFYSLMALGMLLLVWHFKHFDRLYRIQTIIILAGAIVPWIANLIYLLGLRPHQHIDLTPYAFILTALIIAFGLTRYKLFDIVPFAREKLIENLREGMLIVDEQNRIIDHNSIMQKFLQTNSRLIGKKLPEILSHASIQHLLLKQTEQRIELTLTNEFDTREFEVSATPLQDNRATFSGMLLMFWDITSRKKTTELLRVQAKELQELNDLKNRMFSIIAHDLKSPMAGLLGILQLAETGVYTDEELKRIFPILSRNVDNIRILMDNLLNWARSQLEGSQLHQKLFDIADVAATNTRLFEKHSQEKGIILENKIQKNTWVYGDQDMMDLVIRNLVANAIKFCYSGDSITLEATLQDNMTVIQVIDTGIGMDQTTQATLFQLMSSVRPGTNNEKGTGLGLVLCKEFVMKNNGRIWVESEAGKGSVFYVAIPSQAYHGNVNTGIIQ